MLFLIPLFPFLSLNLLVALKSLHGVTTTILIFSINFIFIMDYKKKKNHIYCVHFVAFDLFITSILEYFEPEIAI